MEDDTDFPELEVRQGWCAFGRCDRPPHACMSVFSADRALYRAFCALHVERNGDQGPPAELRRLHAEKTGAHPHPHHCPPPTPFTTRHHQVEAITCDPNFVQIP
jgi:hypothetical protein